MSEAVKSHGLFKYLSPIYDIIAKFAMLGQYDRLRRQLLGKIQISRDRRILDAACGTGYLAERLEAAQTVCIDISIDMLKQARSKSSGEFVQADAHRLPFRTGAFDAAVSSFALHEVARPDRVIAEMFRTLRPGGELAVMDVLQQKRISRKILLQLFHTFIEFRTASYTDMDVLKSSFSEAEDFNVQWDMFDLVALVWGKKKGVRPNPASDQ